MKSQDDHIAVARELWNTGNKQEAINSLVERSDLASFRSLIWMYEQYGDFDKALTFAKKAYETSKTSKDRAMLAIIYSDRGNNNLAFFHAKRAIQKDNLNDLAHFALSVTYLKWGDLFQAKDSLDKAIKINPKHSGYRLWLAMYYLNSGDSNTAIQLLNELKDNDNFTTDIQENIHWALYNLADTADQKTLYLEEILQVTPDDYSAHKILIRLLIKERLINKATTELMILEKKKGYKKDWEFHLLLGDCHLLNGNHKDARDSYIKAQHLFPKSDLIHQRIGDIFSILNEQENAIKFYIASQKFVLPTKNQKPYHLPIIEDDRIIENRMIAYERIGAGPDSYIALFFENVKSVPDALLKITLFVLIFLVAGFVFSIATLGSNLTAFYENLIERYISPITIIFLGGSIVCLLWALYYGLKKVTLHPRFISWFVFLLIIYFPLLYPFYKTILSEPFRKSFSVNILIVLMFWAFLLYGVILIFKTGIELNKKFVSRTALIAFVITLLPLTPIIFSVRESINSLQLLPSEVVLKILPSLLFDYYFIFAPVYIMVLLTYFGFIFLRSEIKNKFNRVFEIWKQVKKFRKQFVQDWGFSGHLIDSALWTVPCIFLLLAYQVSKLLVFCFFLLVFCLLPLRGLGIAFLHYTLSPISYKRLNIEKINLQINRFSSIDTKSQKPAILLISLSVTLAILFLFWLNYSTLVLSINYIFIQNLISPNGAISEIDIFEWLYQTLQLTVTGNFDLETNKITKFLLTPLSFSNFFFLTLFFSQLISNFSELGREKPE